jgi:hypothetical protein
LRQDIPVKEFLKRERVAAINRLHALYGQAGITGVTKKDSRDSKGRKARHGELPPELAEYADILEEQLDLFEKRLEAADEKVNEKARNHELAPYIMPVPGIGIGIAAVVLAYMGDGSRFSTPGQAANYAGLAPQADCSGKTERYGPIAKYQFCHPIRGVVREGVWAAIARSGKGPLSGKFTSLSERMRGEEERGGSEDGDAGVADAGAAIDETERVLQRDKQRSSGEEAYILHDKKGGGIGSFCLTK